MTLANRAPTMLRQASMSSVDRGVRRAVHEVAAELPSSTSPLRAFRHGDFALLCAGAFVSNVGTWMERVAVGVWVTQSTGSASWTGWVTAMLFLPVAVLGPVGGTLSDRSSRRRWLIGVTVAQAVIAAALALLAQLSGLNLALMSLLMFLTGCASVLLSAGFNALIAELVPKNDLTSAMFLNSGQWNLARVVGPLLAAPVIAWSGPALAFWLNTLSFLAVLWVVLRMRIPPHVPAEHEPVLQGVLNGLRTARGDPGIFSALIITAVAGLLIAPFIGLVPVFAIETLHEGPAAASLLTAMQGLGAVIAALVSGAWLDRVGAGRWLKGACTAVGLATAVYWLTPSLGLAMVVMVVLGASYLSVITSSSRVCLGRAPMGSQARVASLFHSTLDTTYAVGLIAVGAAADRTGLREAGVACAVLFGVTMLVLARARRNLFSAL
jgi:MFS family permease